MTDMLVKLYDLPAPAPLNAELEAEGVLIRRALPPEKHAVVSWVERNFSRAWASECDVALAHQPAGCFIALEGKKIVGFACCEATCKNFFGPMGVLENQRGRGVGKALLLIALAAMREAGYAYAIIGAVGPTGFYKQTVGATPIGNSAPGIYRGLLHLENE